MSRSPAVTGGGMGGTVWTRLVISACFWGCKGWYPGQCSEWLFLPGADGGRNQSTRNWLSNWGLGKMSYFSKNLNSVGKLNWTQLFLILRSLHLIYFYRHDSYLFQPSWQGYSDFFVRLLYRLVTFLKKIFFFFFAYDLEYWHAGVFWKGVIFVCLATHLADWVATSTSSPGLCA